MRSRTLTASLLTAVRVGLAVGGATAGLLLVRTFLSTSTVALLYLLPVGFSAALGGLWAGAGAAVLSFLAFNYFFIPPYYTFTVHQTQDLLALLVFLVVAVVMSQLMARAQTSLAHAQQREREATHLYELSNALAGLQDEHAIVHALAEHAQQSFGAEWVEVSLEPRGAAPSLLTWVWPPGPLPKSAGGADIRAPLQTARGLVGEMRLWRAQATFSPGEERLLSTFASQGALALERARLAVAETRAKISEESDRLKSALLSSVSHELRTPLATVKAAVTSLRGGAVGWDTEARKDLLASRSSRCTKRLGLQSGLPDNAPAPSEGGPGCAGAYTSRPYPFG
jgi:two-component system sensor histidine kinase KdpD